MFYLTLPSNSSIDYYSDNTLTNYVTQLQKPIELDGAWEVGLAEIQYPHTWYNVNQGEAMMRLKTTEDGQVYTTILREGLYDSPILMNMYPTVETSYSFTTTSPKRQPWM